MDIGGMVGSLLRQYAGGSTADAAAAEQHYDQATQSLDQGSLSSAIGSMMRSSDTPSFGNMVGQIFRNGSGDQKASMLNTILAGAGPAVLSQLSHLIPGLGTGSTITAAQAESVPTEVVQQAAQHAEQHDPSVVDRMSSVFAAHPTLVKTLGSAAMIIALREMAKKFTPNA